MMGSGPIERWPGETRSQRERGSNSAEPREFPRAGAVAGLRSTLNKF